jgi:hypothetical protein
LLCGLDPRIRAMDRSRAERELPIRPTQSATNGSSRRRLIAAIDVRLAGAWTQHPLAGRGRAEFYPPGLRPVLVTMTLIGFDMTGGLCGT